MTAVQVLLVRHGHAGSKTRWTGEDRLRPLSVKGRRDARRLAGVLGRFSPGSIVSSPYRRCLQTVDPLAASTGLVVVSDDALAPDAGILALKLLREAAAAPAGGPAVVCTHGEVITEVLAALSAEDGLTFGPKPPNEKGSVWVLDAAGEGFTAASYLGPGGDGG